MMLLDVLIAMAVLFTCTYSLVLPASASRFLTRLRQSPIEHLEETVRNHRLDAFRAIVQTDKQLFRESDCLHIAVEEDNEIMVDEIISCGVDLNRPDRLGRFPMYIASYNAGSNAVMKMLLKVGAHPDLGEVRNMSVVSTPLLRAIATCHSFCALDAVAALASARADVDQVDQFGYSPLLLAVERDQKEVVKFLLSRGADITIRSPSGKSVLEIAPNKEMREILQNQAYMLDRMCAVKPPVPPTKVLGLYTKLTPQGLSQPAWCICCRRACSDPCLGLLQSGILGPRH
jgi:hypothetical protein